MSDQEKCHYCERPAQFLCDATVKLLKGTTVMKTTCSRPMCEQHRIKAGSGIACSRGRGRGRGCRPLSIDYCADHDTEDKRLVAAACVQQADRVH